MEDVLGMLNAYFGGWVNYYGLTGLITQIEGLAKWTRRRIRAKYLKQWKRTYTRATNIQKLWKESGQYPRLGSMWASLKGAHGIWRLAANPAVQSSLTNKYLESQGFPKMLELYDEAHSRLLNRRIPTGTYGGVRGRRTN